MYFNKLHYFYDQLLKITIFIKFLQGLQYIMYVKN